MLLGSIQLGLVAIFLVQMISELILSYVITYREHKSAEDHLLGRMASMTIYTISRFNMIILQYLCFYRYLLFVQPYFSRMTPPFFIKQDF